MTDGPGAGAQLVLVQGSYLHKYNNMTNWVLTADI